jgi:hypothetical protein
MLCHACCKTGILFVLCKAASCWIYGLFFKLGWLIFLCFHHGNWSCLTYECFFFFKISLPFDYKLMRWEWLVGLSYTSLVSHGSPIPVFLYIPVVKMVLVGFSLFFFNVLTAMRGNILSRSDWWKHFFFHDVFFFLDWYVVECRVWAWLRRLEQTCWNL